MKLYFINGLKTLKSRFTEINNPFFTAAAQERLIEKKRLEMTVNTNLTSILSCRSAESIIKLHLIVEAS